MLGKLLKKEFSLAMHPTVPIMLLLCAMVLIPNYPYPVIYFYITLSLFFTCLMGRENNDVVYSLSLPVSKSSIVKARFLFAAILQLVSLLLTVPFICLAARLNPAGNAAGMDANAVLIGQGFVLYGLFNLVFFTQYYKDISKVGVPFIKASVAVFLLVPIDIIGTYAVPYVRDILDTPGAENLTAKLVCTSIGAVVYSVLTVLSFRISVKRFKKQDM